MDEGRECVNLKVWVSISKEEIKMYNLYARNKFSGNWQPLQQFSTISEAEKELNSYYLPESLKCSEEDRYEFRIGEGKDWWD